jgi:TetR/AcrR family transcriptional repressor of nem operon
MARPQVFNRQLVMGRAIKCFWEKGYSETSLADLLKAMNISRSTFYNSFGDKRQLFELCLLTYSQQSQQVLAMTLLNEKMSTFDAIRQFLYIVLVAPNDDVSALGCLLVNSIAETSKANDELHAIAVELMQPVRLGFIHQLSRVFDESNSKHHGEWLFTQLLGWRLQCQMGLEKKVLERQINWALLILKSDFQFK